MEMTVIWIEFGLFCAILFVIAHQLRRIRMTQDEVAAKLVALKVSIDALLALPPAQTDLQALGDQVDAIKAEVDAKLPPAA
jgi:hypothetical protein